MLQLMTASSAGSGYADVDLAENKIFINQGKGAKDRYVLFRTPSA